MAKTNLRDRVATLEVAKKRVANAKGARTLAEQWVANLEAKLGEMEIKLAKVETVVSTKDKEVADLMVALEESENKFYDLGFADAENSSKPIMFKLWRYGFNKGWMVAVNALGIPKDSPFRDPEQIPYLEPHFFPSKIRPCEGRRKPEHESLD